MTSDRLYEAIGDISDKHISEAKQIKKPAFSSLTKWGLIAACLCIAIIVAFTMRSDNEDVLEDNMITSSSSADVAPMIYVNNTLYKQSVKQTYFDSLPEDFVYIGTIESDITADQSTANDGVPKENYQANTPIVGSEIYQYGNDIVVKIDNSFWLYKVLDENYNREDWDSLSEEEKMQLDPTYIP